MGPGNEASKSVQLTYGFYTRSDVGNKQSICQAVKTQQRRGGLLLECLLSYVLNIFTADCLHHTVQIAGTDSEEGAQSSN